MIEVSIPEADGTTALAGDLWVCLATNQGKPGECSKVGDGARLVYGRPMHAGTITVTLGAPGGIHVALGEWGGLVCLVRRSDGEPLFALDYTFHKNGKTFESAIRTAAQKKK